MNEQYTECFLNVYMMFWNKFDGTKNKLMKGHQSTLQINLWTLQLSIKLNCFNN